MKFPDPSHWLHSPWNCQGWAMPIWKSLGSAVLPQNWKFMWNSYILHFLYFLKKSSSFVILLTLFTRNCPFLYNFDKNLILLIWLTHVNEKCAKISFALSPGLFLFKCISHFSKNKFLSKLTKNGQFLVNKVQKITSDNFFSIKYKMCRMCDFHIDF